MPDVQRRRRVPPVSVVLPLGSPSRHHGGACGRRGGHLDDRCEGSFIDSQKSAVPGDSQVIEPFGNFYPSLLYFLSQREMSSFVRRWLPQQKYQNKLDGVSTDPQVSGNLLPTVIRRNSLSDTQVMSIYY